MFKWANIVSVNVSHLKSGTSDILNFISDRSDKSFFVTYSILGKQIAMSELGKIRVADIMDFAIFLGEN